MSRSTRHLIRFSDAQEEAERRTVQRHRRRQTGSTGEDDKAHAVPIQLIYKAINFVFGLIQTAGLNIFSIHASGQVQGNQQVDALPLYFAHFRAYFRSRRGNDEQGKSNIKANITYFFTQWPESTSQFLKQLRSEILFPLIVYLKVVPVKNSQ